MSARTPCPICSSAGLVKRQDTLSPSIAVHEPCPLGCPLPLPDYAAGYRPDDPDTWPEWIQPQGHSQVEERRQHNGRGQDDGVRDQS